ncbi:MAG: hypothetical protein AB4426_31830 [Xenococcaceae cyanobacterium]
MAKRRDLKKEKAERNKAYARKFRKTSNRRFYRTKRFQSSQNQENTQESAAG